MAIRETMSFISNDRSLKTQSKLWQLMMESQVQKPLATQVKSRRTHASNLEKEALEIASVETMDRYPHGAYHFAGTLPMESSGTLAPAVTVQASRHWRRENFVRAGNMPSFHMLRELI